MLKLNKFSNMSSEINARDMDCPEDNSGVRIKGGLKRASVAPPKHLKKKMKRDDLYKPPTTEELNELQEAETMFHSSLFRLQVDEMISEVKMKAKHQESLKSWLESFKVILKEIPESEVYKIYDKSWVGKGIKVPISMLPKNRKGFFKFLPPLDVFEVGSYALETTCSQQPVIDVALKVPKACWQKIDHLNHLYHRKRALYLTYIAKFLKNHEAIEDLKFSFQDDCHLRPVLLLTPKGNVGKWATIRLLPYPEEGSFKLNRFIPLRNNIRKSWYYKTESTDEDTDIATPFYNSTLLLDILIPNVADFLKKSLSSESVKVGIILLKVWCIQRDMLGGRNGVNGFMFSMLVAYLLVHRKISHLMSSYQVFRNALLALKREDWATGGVTMCADSGSGQPTLEDFKKHNDIIFVDPSGFLNMCYSLHQETFSRVTHEAEIALNILDSASSESFSQLFLYKVPFCRKFEYMFNLRCKDKLVYYCKHLGIENSVIDHCGDCITSLIPKMCEILRKGLKDRALLIGVDTSKIEAWELNKVAPKPNSAELTFGILYNQAFVFTNLEKGPVADSPFAREFRSFWGEKSELRRFKDGGIHEAILWPADTIEEKRYVLPAIIKYILQHHVGIDHNDVGFCGSDIDDTLHVPKKLCDGDFSSYGTGEETFLPLLQSFDALSSELRRLDGLPLAISSVQGKSSSFRFSEVFPPLSRAHVVNKSHCTIKSHSVLLSEDGMDAPAWVSPLEAIIYFEGSGKWPDDIDALQRVKAALYLKIAELLKDRFYLCTRPTATFVDVLKNGYVFRLKVACHKEIGLLKKIKTPEGMVKIKETTESQELECQTEILPKLNSVLHGLHQQHNTYGTACRFAKRWMSCQLLQNYVDDIVIELIMASVYIDAGPFTCPSSPQLAFQRFLGILHKHDWERNPLIVNLNNDIKKSEIVEILSDISSKRTTLPAMIIVTPLDRSGCMWTKHSPSLVILKRLVLLSRVSLETFEKQLLKSSPEDFMQIFRPPLNPYDVLIYLNLKQVPKACFALEGVKNVRLVPFKSYHKKSDESMPIIEYDPVACYLQELRECYHEFALFFYDAYGGDYIAVKWRPDAFKSKPFKVSNINGRSITGANADGTFNIVPNVEAILDGFEKLGSGLVKNIVKKTETWNIS